MTISDLAIKKPVFAWMLMITFMVLGGIAFTRLGVSQMPDVDFPTVSVSLTWEGASPEIMENDVVDLVEDAVMSVEGIKEVTSTSRHGTATVTIEFELNRNIDAALQDVQTKIAQAQRNLPKDLDPPVVSKNNPEDSPIMWVSLVGQRKPSEMSDIVRNQLRDQLQSVPGVGDITMGGFLNRNVRIWIDAEKLDTYQLSVDEVIAALQRQHIEVPAGRIESSIRELNVRSEGEALSLDDFRKIVIATRGISQIPLSEVAVVEDGLEDKRRISRSNGESAQGMGIRKQRGSNAVAVARAVRAKIDELRKRLPSDLSLEVVFDSTPYVEESIHEIEMTMILAIFLTAFVCWLFLGSFSSTINIVLAIPTSILGTFAVMYFMGFTINTFTLLALSLSIGIVVDDAIMVLENIFRHRQMGKDKVTAARDGAREITFAALAATVAIIAIFLPIAFMKGIIGKFLFQFGVVLSVSVFLSLIEALTIAPARCSQFLAAHSRSTRFGRSIDFLFEKLSDGYRWSLGPAIRFRWIVLVVSGGVFAASLLLVSMLRQELIPPQDQSRIQMRLTTPVGSSIDYTDRITREVEAIVMKLPELDRYFVAIGGFGGGEVNTANMFATLKPAKERERTMLQVMGELRQKIGQIPGLRASIMDATQQNFSAQRGSKPVEASIRGSNWDELAGLAHAMMDKMKDSGLMVDVDTDYQVGMPEVHIVPDRIKAAQAGVSMETIGTTVSSLIGGTRVAKYKEGGRRYDVRVRLLRDQRLKSSDVRAVKVRSETGELVPLSEVVKVIERPTMLSITRRGRERSISVNASVTPGKSEALAFAEVEKQWKSVAKEGYRLVFTGAALVAQETQSSLYFVMGLGLFIAYVVLASQFNSFIHPITVFLALPFSLSGALVALWWADMSLNLYSGIGIVLLMGIAKKNSILLVDYTNQRREAGADWKTALREACPVRLRPILMTSLSTVAGALPAALSLGAGSELIRPMALSVIGGIMVSTIFTLFVVPAFYGMVEDVKAFLRRLFHIKPPEIPAKETDLSNASAAR